MPMPWPCSRLPPVWPLPMDTQAPSPPRGRGHRGLWAEPRLLRLRPQPEPQNPLASARELLLVETLFRLKLLEALERV